VATRVHALCVRDPGPLLLLNRTCDPGAQQQRRHDGDEESAYRRSHHPQGLAEPVYSAARLP
jgi:hypothetical protein